MTPFRPEPFSHVHMNIYWNVRFTGAHRSDLHGLVGMSKDCLLPAYLYTWAGSHGYSHAAFTAIPVYLLVYKGTIMYTGLWKREQVSDNLYIVQKLLQEASTVHSALLL